MDFEYYVLNFDNTTNTVNHFNIFWNGSVNEATEKAIRKYLRAPKKFSCSYHDKTYYGFDALCEELRSIFMWQMCGRYEYEIAVGRPFAEAANELRKIDAYYQLLPNIKTITRDVIQQYKECKRNEQK